MTDNQTRPVKRAALITGASSGMGREFARRLVNLGECDELWLVARRREEMEKLSTELGVPARIVCADLATEEGLTALKDALAEAKPTLSWVISAAGFGVFGRFDEVKAAADRVTARKNSEGAVAEIIGEIEKIRRK